MNNPKREKRAYVAYLEVLLQQEQNDPMLLIDGNTIYFEIQAVEKIIRDLDIIIKRQENEV